VQRSANTRGGFTQLDMRLTAFVLFFSIHLTPLLAEAPSLPDRDPKLACELVEQEDALLLDVRTWWEYSAYRLSGARNIWVGVLSKRLDEVAEALGGKKDKAIVVYCTKGVRAAKAKQILQDAGFSRVTNLGGISDWMDCR